MEIMEVVFSSLNADQTLSSSFEAQTIHVPSHQKKNQTIFGPLNNTSKDMTVRKPPLKTCHVLISFKQYKQDNLPGLDILQTIQARHFLINSANRTYHVIDRLRCRRGQNPQHIAPGMYGTTYGPLKQN
jgi:hypothetical protein